MNKYTIGILIIIVLVLGIYFITKGNSQNNEVQSLVNDSNCVVEELENGNYIIYNNNSENQKEVSGSEARIYMIDSDYNPDPTGEYTPTDDTVNDTSSMSY